MNIRKVSFGLIGAVMTLGTVYGCSESKYTDKAKEEAVKYLRGEELLKAERFAAQQTNYDRYNGQAIAYWDSLLFESKAKEAYQKGKQLIQDSLNGIHYRKEKFKAPLDTIIKQPDNLVENLKNEYAKYTNANDFIAARDNAPDDFIYSLRNNLAASTHYWNLITCAGKQQEAYNIGLSDARKELKK